MAISNPGAGHSGATGTLNSVPASKKATLSSNYIDFTADGNDWGQQYLPDLMESEAEVFGNRTIAGFLSQVGAEEAMSSDQVIWSEQGRLHLSYVGKYDNNEDTFTFGTDIDGNAIASGEHGVRINDMVIVAYNEGVIKCFVTAASATAVTIMPYEVENGSDATAFSDTGVPSANNATLLVIGSEYGKGKQGQGGSASTTAGFGTVKPTHTSFHNKPIIIKDYYEISGSDTSQIGWVEISGEEGQNGYLWYLKAEGDTRARFADYLEMTYGAGGTSYGVFNNSEDMALNLGFSGFRRGSYDFYKSDFRYLNDKSTRGSINSRAAGFGVRGVIIPAGVSTVYDQTLGRNLKRPFLHVRYRASQMEDRKMKTWITGSVGGNVTSDLDAMQVHYLSERCLITQGANNFMLMK